jgi:tRNA pseudouridine13 synthase
MKVKRLPEDFQVEELPHVAMAERGRYIFYRLTKRGLGTLEALEAIRRRWNLAGRQISVGGLKDRHAVTVQYLTIAEGPEKALRESSFELEPIGRLSQPYGPNHFRGNRFAVVLRDLTPAAVERAVQSVNALPRDGLPNYFDNQRFGSVGQGGRFIAHAWLLGEYEDALRLALAEPNASDRPDTRTEKAVLRRCWGRWEEAKEQLPRSHARSIVTYLVDHPTDYRGAFARLRRELRSLYFSAFQSHLWNMMLGRLIERITRSDQRTPVPFKVATFPIHHDLDADQAAILAATRIPLPASRSEFPSDELLATIAQNVLDTYGLTWNNLRVKHLRDVFFSKGARLVLFFADGLASEVGADELAAGRQKLRLTFELPKGAYATLVVKRLTVAALA